MIKVENIEVMNFKAALRGMRNPLESWNNSDTQTYIYTNAKHSMSSFNSQEHRVTQYIGLDAVCVEIGSNDLELAQSLVLAGTDHSKFMRQIFVSMDITSSLYWWKEMDTYKVGTVTNSESTMHRLATTSITRDLFSLDVFNNQWDERHFLVNHKDKQFLLGDIAQATINYLEDLRLQYIETKDKRYWRALIQLLPSSWNQMRTWTANYQVLRNIYFARRNHKLQEWEDFCKIIEELPYGRELICVERE